MHPCLRLPEVVRLICSDSDDEDVYHLALTSRIFLDTSLDRLWCELDSFDPLLACLPGDLWNKPETEMTNWRVFKPLSLRRPLVAEDCQRYLTCYAHRIRSFIPEVDWGMLLLNPEALQAIQVVTGYRPGALAPLLESFYFLSPVGLASVGAGRDFLERLYPTMQLFLPPSLQSIQFEICTSYPVYTTVIRTTLGNYPHLKRISIDVAEETSSVNPYLTLGKWDKLEVLEVNRMDDDVDDAAAEDALGHLIHAVTPETIPILAALPRLRKLMLTESAHVPPRYASEKEEAPEAFVGPDMGFTALEDLQVTTTGNLQTTIGILQHLNPSNKVSKLFFQVFDFPATVRELHDVFHTMRAHLNPDFLEDVTFGDRVCHLESVPESSDMHIEDAVDISLLFKFEKMRSLRILSMAPIDITPDIIKQIPTVWPKLEVLDLCGQFTTSRLPMIDHTDFLSLLEGCPSLTIVGLRFDASKITGEEVSAKAPFRLESLKVGESPIYSPARVAKFLRSNCPRLIAPHAHAFEESSKMKMYRDRWCETHTIMRKSYLAALESEDNTS